MPKKHHTRRRPNSSNCDAFAGDAPQGAVVLWCLRILARFVDTRGLVRMIDGFNDETRVALGLQASEKGSTAAKLRARVRNLLARQERCSASLTEPLAANLADLGRTLNLNPLECRIVAFTVLAQSHPLLDDVTGGLSHDLDGAHAVRLLAVALSESTTDVNRALRNDGALARSGLLRLDRNGAYALRHKFDLLEGLPDALLTARMSPMELLSRYFREASSGTLASDDFPHLASDLALLTPYLERSAVQAARGVNILLHGRPGTGKSELARLLAQRCGLTLYEVSMDDASGDPLAGRERFGAYQLCQSVLSRRHDCLVLFDEVEDVFPPDILSLLGVGRIDSRKAWVNRVLESNPAPALWLCNSPNDIDPAHLRRFDYILEMRVPPRSVRRRILDRHFESLPVGEAFLQQMSEHPHLSPAMVERAARVVSRLGEPKPDRSEALLERIMGNSLEALGQPRRPPAHTAPVCTYDLAFVNADYDVAKIASGLARRPSARLCLYGPPGTGKTAYAHHLAEKLDRPLLVKRTSDLLSMWIGQTEQQIAAMFREAEIEGAVLFLDEADSMLRERQGASQSWEVTQVNELLVQMEVFEGIFVAATNLAEVLDAASLRRFDLKVKFEFLSGTQAEALFAAVLSEQGQDDHLQTEARQRLRALDNLAPGDFATVIRQAHAVGDDVDAQLLLGRLIAECMVKTAHGGRGIGFVSKL